MAALSGFDGIAGAAVVAAPFASGQTILSVAVPARTVVAGFDLSVSQLDANAAPTVTLDIGDGADADRYIATSPLAQAGGEYEFRPASAAWWRYAAADAVVVRIGTDAATDAPGTISLVLYTYPGVDISVAARQVLNRLGVLAEGETPRAEYENEALLALAETHEAMRYKSLASRQDLAWPLALLPVFAVRSYATMAAFRLVGTFGLPMARKQMLAAMAGDAERELRRMTYTKTSGAPVSLEPYLRDEGGADYAVYAP